jgi:hypothetical protein
VEHNRYCRSSASQSLNFMDRISDAHPSSLRRSKKSTICFLSTTWKMTMHRSDSSTALSSCNGILFLVLWISITDFMLLRALMPPGYHKEWHIGVRVSSNKKLVAFISGVPLTLRVREQCVSLLMSFLTNNDPRSPKIAHSLRAKSIFFVFTRNCARSV